MNKKSYYSGGINRLTAREPEDRVFFFHFNKPLSKQRGKPQISVHYRGACNIVDNVVCTVPIRGHINKRQPYFVMKGKGQLRIEKGIAYLE